MFLCVFLAWLSLLLNLCHYAKFASDGAGAPSAEHAYFFFDFVSQIVLLYIVLLICKGSETAQPRGSSTVQREAGGDAHADRTHRAADAACAHSHALLRHSLIACIFALSRACA